MVKVSKKFIAGIGSVLDIYPVKHYSIKSYIPGRTTTERLRGDWIKVGRSLEKAVSLKQNVKR